jgi:DNA-binding response OmpR family regulator
MTQRQNGARWVLLAARNDARVSVLEREIHRRTSWPVKRVRSGGGALRALSTRAPDVVLIDAELPIVSAEELCYILRRRPKTAEIPIVVVAFKGVDRTREMSALSAGADEYADGASLSAVWPRVQTALVRRHLAADSRQVPIRQYRSAGLYANFGDSFVSVDGRPIVMQPLEFALLRYFVTRRNQLITRQQVLRDVWCGRRSIESRTVDVHVCRLRRQLGSAATRIQTLVSRGYRFVDDVTDAGRSPQ